MNLVILTHNKRRKAVDAVMKNTAHTVLGYETVIRGTTVTRILEHHVPHCVVICDDVQEKEGITKADVITLLHARRPSLRIITVTDRNDIEYFSFLKDNAVFDHISEWKELPDVLEMPMTEQMLDNRIEEIKAAQEAAEAAAQEKEIAEEKAEHQPVDLSFPAVSAIGFDMNTVERIVIPEQRLIDKMTVGIAQLQHHNGCTHTSFEIAALLKEKKASVCVVLFDPDTFHDLAVFHKLDPEQNRDGLKVNGIHVFPVEKLDAAKQQYDCVICDISLLRDENRQLYNEMQEKIMLCSAAEWDIAKTMHFVNYEQNMNVRKVIYCFPRVSRKKFIGINKQMMKAGCTAFRLHNSIDWTAPCEENIAVYHQVIGKYLNIPVKKEKRRLFRK
ncbi:MAG: hypothetical protein IKQ91_01710 [Oscillospiraceae bacterium]|nr:hypothetical protein [Oscillospiraceae bacterium]